MRILLVDDDDYKRNQIATFLMHLLDMPSIEVARSFQSGLAAISRGGFELVILDMTMPTFDITEEEGGGQPQAYAGRELLKYMSRRKINMPAIVITQFDRFGEGSSLLTLDELREKLKEAELPSYLGAIHYNVSYDSWKEELKGIVEKILELEKL